MGQKRKEKEIYGHKEMYEIKKKSDFKLIGER